MRRSDWRVVWGGVCLAASLMGMGSVAAAPMAASLPEPVVRDLRALLGGGDVRTLSGELDLNDDGRPEVVVYAVGPMICGTGGCNLLVYTPETNGYRRVGNIAITQTPIRVSTERSKGWRNLVVHVAGGGAKPADMVLKFDGHLYPHNPSVPGGQVQPAALASADVLIANFNSLEDAQPLPMVLAPQASFDCSKALRAAERVVCSNEVLATLDRDVAAAYTKAMSPDAEWPAADRAALKTSQRAWLKTRERCLKASDAQTCMSTLYQRRLITLKIQLGDAGPVPSAVGYQCEGLAGTPVTVVFYSEFETPAAVITVGDQQSVAFLQRTASGARYVAPGLDFWEHHGEAQLTRARQRHTCSVLRAP